MPPNKDFGPFELQERIGKGGMASVYRAVQKSLQRPVVLKILYPHLAEDEKLVQRFEREARAAAMMRHENIVQVIDCGRHDDVAYIAMEYVEGNDLKHWLDHHGAPPMEIALLLLRDLCRGLEHAHGHRIIHRDIKPANLMLTPDGVTKIMDFGLARSGADTATQMTLAGSVLGTPAYMSPEQATGDVVDERSDVFSVGVVAFELLGGTRPFQGESYSSVLRQILTVEPPDVTHFNPLVPEEVARLVRGMLQKDVSKRIPTIRQVREELETIIEQMGLLRARDLLREWALDPEPVGDRWRQKRLSRHLDQGLYYENMGLGKIDDALLEFRRVLHLDPSNSVARDHARTLERELARTGSKPAPAEPSPALETPRVAEAPSKPSETPTGSRGPSPAVPAAAPTDAERTVLFAPGQGLASPAAAPSPSAAAPKPAPAAAAPVADGGDRGGPPRGPVARPGPTPPRGGGAPAKPAPAPAPKSPKAAAPRAAEGTGKRRVPVPLIAGLGVLAVLIVVVVMLIVAQGRHADESSPTAARDTSSATPSKAAPSAPTPAATPAPQPAAPTAPAATPGGVTLADAHALYDAGKFDQATTALREGIARHVIPASDERQARELLARALVRNGQARDARREYVAILRANPGFQPYHVGLTRADRLAFAAAERVLADTAKTKAAAPAVAAKSPGTKAVDAKSNEGKTPPAAGTGTVVVTAKPFAASVVVDGKVVDANKSRFQFTLSAGHHTIVARHPTLGEKTWNETVADGKTYPLDVDFEASAGSIQVSSDGSWGEIYMDGVRIGHTTPWQIAPVSPGSHEISLVREGWTVEGGAKTVKLAAGASESVHFTLKASRK